MKRVIGSFFVWLMVSVGVFAADTLREPRSPFTTEQRREGKLDPEPLQQDDMGTLRHTLRSGTKDERAKAALAVRDLGVAGKPLGPELVRLLKDPSPDVQRAAFTALEQIGIEPSWFVPVVWEVLEDDHYDVVDAQRTLKRKGFDPSVVAQILAEALGVSDRFVRRDAALMLLRLGTAMGSARSALERAAEHDEDPVVRDYAQEALGYLAEQ